MLKLKRRGFLAGISTLIWTVSAQAKWESFQDFGPQPPPPTVTVTAISPVSGLTAGGTQVNITGTGFTTAASANIDGAPLTSLFVVSDTSITAVTSSHVTANGLSVNVITASNATNVANTLYSYTGQPGTGLSAASAFLPSTLPQVPAGSTAAGGGWHLTARPWSPLGITAATYLQRVKGEASYWSTHLDGNGDVINPYGSFDDDRGKTPNSIGVLILSGDTSLVPNGITMLSRAVATYSTTGRDFTMQPTFFAISLFAPLVGSFGITSTTIANWYTGMNNYFGAGNPNNWVTYDMAGLWSGHLDAASGGAPQLTNANFSVPATNINTIEGLWNQQLTVGGIAGTGAYGNPPFYTYRDGTGPPDSMALDCVARLNLAGIIGAGYNGPSATTGLDGQPSLDFITTAGALTALLTQDPTGQGAVGGRQAFQNWTDAAAQVSHEIMAHKFSVSNSFLAGQFAHAGQLTFNSISRWANPNIPGTFFITKNHYDPSLNSGVGIGGQSPFQYTYNNDLGQFTALAYRQRIMSDAAGVTEKPCPAEIGGFAFRVNSVNGTGTVGTQTFAFANAGGTHIQLALTGQTAVASGQFWTAPGFQRIGRVNWETRLGPPVDGYMQPNAVTFGPTWFNGSVWQRLAANPSTVSGVFSTTFVSPVLVMCRVVWTVSGGTFTQDITITPDGVMVQTTQSGFSAGNWGVTFPILTVDGTTSPNTWGATTTGTSIGSTPGIASAVWPNGDSQNFIVVTSNTPVLTQETSCQTAAGNVIPVRSVVAADITHTTFVYPASVNDLAPNNVQSSFSVTGPNSYNCPLLNSSVISSAVVGTVYIGRTSCGGWGNDVVLPNNSGTITFSSSCFFVAQIANGVVTNVEVDRAVTATVQGNAPRSMIAYTPSSFP